MKTLKIILSAIAGFFILIAGFFLKGYVLGNDGQFFKLVQEAKKNKKAAENERRQAGVSYKKAVQGNPRRRDVRNKYSKIVMILLLIMLLPALLHSRYIVWDPEDQVNRDYGNITNYIRSLEEEKIIFLASQGYLYETISHYSNAYEYMTNVIILQEKIIQEQKPTFWELIWDKSKFFVGFVLGGVIVYSLK